MEFRFLSPPAADEPGAGFSLDNQMDTKVRARRPLNRLYVRDYYWDHDKRLRDAEIAQNGIEDSDYHADGVHRYQPDPYGKR